MTKNKKQKKKRCRLQMSSEQNAIISDHGGVTEVYDLYLLIAWLESKTLAKFTQQNRKRHLCLCLFKAKRN